MKRKPEDTLMVSRLMLMKLLEANFYSDCNIHGGVCVHFCISCSGSILCNECINSNQHEDHRVIRIFKASRQLSLRANTAGTLLDIADIQVYINNSKPTVFIKQRRPELHTVLRSRDTDKCVRCQWSLESRMSKYTYCSIECKVRSVDIAHVEQPNNNGVVVDLDHDIAVVGDVVLSNSKSFRNPNSFRKITSKRKGIPRRSSLA